MKSQIAWQIQDATPCSTPGIYVLPALALAISKDASRIRRGKGSTESGDTLLWHHLEKVKPAERERQLTSVDFTAVFQMSFAEFSTLPLWQQRLRWDESVSLNL